MATITMDVSHREPGQQGLSAVIGIAATSNGIVDVGLRGAVAPCGPENDPAARAILADAVAQFEQYFAGQRTDIDVPLDGSVREMLAGDSFRARALNALRDIPYGDVVTYAELAALAGSPRAARAAGTVCSTNPLAIIIPCHRVVPASGGIGSYGGGEPLKHFLLDLEGSLGAL